MIEGFAAFKNAPSDGKVTGIHSLLTANTGLLADADRELILLLSCREVSGILGIPIERNDIGDSVLDNLIVREQLREWTNLPQIFKKQKVGVRVGISLMSVFEYMVVREKGIVNEEGKFSQDKNQVALQKDVLRRILAQVPDWEMRLSYSEAAETRFLRSMATSTGPTPPGVGV